MFGSASRRAAHNYTPMIKFLGQRSKIEHAPHPPAPHPAAPKEIADTFQSFLAKLQSSSGGAESPPSQPKGQSQSEGAEGKTGGKEAENDRVIGESRGSEYAAAGGGSSSGSGSGSKSTLSSGGSSQSAGKDSAAGSGRYDFENFWEAPEYYWKPREMSEKEMEAVMSGGATDIRSGP